MSTVSRKVRKVRNQAKSLGLCYQFFFMRANGSQLRKLAALYDCGKLRPVIDRTAPFGLTLEAMAHVEQGRTKADKVGVSMGPDNDRECRVRRHSAQRPNRNRNYSSRN
ncbi:zinc-binding dehydrogenase [Streptomyces canus]|uniref:zinc-binding dehydrogenase n=1 Tax=Streptomyces canus TaxID=58343 RepID=UPI000381B7D5|nr:zinc-binding dehydrogenase [Streptomyces canus]